MSAYNAEQHIKRAIQSILNQSYSHFEFIIINDGSTGKTAQIIKDFTDDRIIFIDERKNIGISAARNKGLNIAEGKYIATVDTDDESLPDRFKLQIDFMEQHQDIASLTGTFRQTVTTILNELKQKNLISFDRRRLIRDLEKLS